MNYRLDIQLEAIVDIKKAYEWYEDKRIGLGYELITEIEDCYALISEHPDRYGYINGSPNFRRIRVYRFPYYRL